MAVAPKPAGVGSGARVEVEGGGGSGPSAASVECNIDPSNTARNQCDLALLPSFQDVGVNADAIAALSEGWIHYDLSLVHGRDKILRACLKSLAPKTLTNPDFVAAPVAAHVNRVTRALRQTRQAIADACGVDSPLLEDVLPGGRIGGRCCGQRDCG